MAVAIFKFTVLRDYELREDKALDRRRMTGESRLLNHDLHVVPEAKDKNYLGGLLYSVEAMRGVIFMQCLEFVDLTRRIELRV